MVDLIMYQRDCVDAFRIEFSKEDIKCNSEVKKLAKFINRQGRKIDKIDKNAKKRFRIQVRRII